SKNKCKTKKETQFFNTNGRVFQLFVVNLHLLVEFGFKTYLSSEKFGSNKYFSLFCTRIEDRKNINKV
ncbi:MAG: hypothetical protein LKK01_02685, partial [Prevotella sp.]|nr:hypothetical protein [Prevotella sp.]